MRGCSQPHKLAAAQTGQARSRPRFAVQNHFHADLTPGNILLKAVTMEAGGNVIVKLADFGLSNRLDAHATHVSNFGGGTPFYVAPEVRLRTRSKGRVIVQKGATSLASRPSHRPSTLTEPDPQVVSLKRTSPASDIFSFGVVAW